MPFSMVAFLHLLYKKKRYILTAYENKDPTSPTSPYLSGMSISTTNLSSLITPMIGLIRRFSRLILSVMNIYKRDMDIPARVGRGMMEKVHYFWAGSPCWKLRTYASTGTHYQNYCIPTVSIWIIYICGLKTTERMKGKYGYPTTSSRRLRKRLILPPYNQVNTFIAGAERL